MPSATLLATEAIGRRAGGAGRNRHVGAWISLVCLLGLVLTGVFTDRVAHKPGVYLAQVNVLILPPHSAAVPNSLLSEPRSLSSVAGTVARMVDPNAASAAVVSPTINLANEGIRHGQSVTLPNDGGQFVNKFDRPLLNVQAVGSSAAEVSRNAQHLVDGIRADLATLQETAGVAAADRIHASLNPSGIQVYYLTGSRVRALAATFALGCALTACAALVARRQLARRATTRAPAFLIWPLSNMC